MTRRFLTGSGRSGPVRPPQATPRRSGVKRLRLGAAISLGAAALGFVVGSQLGTEPVPASTAVPRPNIILIVTDDQRWPLKREAMPKTKRLIFKKGIRFSDAIVTTPLCCPSRASILTGQYAHNHGAVSNRAGYDRLVDRENVLPEWLRQAGYHTAHVGKFLNGYPEPGVLQETVGPGWDEWYTMMTPRRFYDHNLSINGTPKYFGTRDRDHISRVLNRRAASVIRRHGPSETPFYLQLDHFAPHTEGGSKSRGGRCGGNVTPDPRDLDLFTDERLPRPPSFNELDVADKPVSVQGLVRIKEARRNRIKLRNQCRLASLRSVDRGVAKVVKALREIGELDQTVIAFMSDNGYFLGEHRIRVNKTFPYEEAVHVPLAMRVPAAYRGEAEAGREITVPVANIDLAPTFLEWAEAEPCIGPGNCRTMDGRSLAGLIRGEGGVPVTRALVVEYGDGSEGDNIRGVCGYDGIRVDARVYIEYSSVAGSAEELCKPAAEREHYDLSADPYQLTNLYPPAPGTPAVETVTELEARLALLQDCAGIAGRDPEPPGRTGYCE